MSPVLLTLAGLGIPPPLKRRALSALAGLTAAAFDCPPPKLDGLPWPARLDAYARFTRAEARRALLRPAALPDVRTRLRDNAFVFGTDMRRRFGAVTRGRALRLARILYRSIGIDFEGGLDGAILIRSCGFSSCYDAAVCELVSALDEGVLAGLTGGGRLEFQERLTEGGAACRGVFRFEEPRVF